MVSRIREVRKRDNRVVPFDQGKIAHAIYRALRSVGEGDHCLSDELAAAVVHFLEERFEGRIPGIEDIQDFVETVLMEMGHPKVAKAYILYRQKRRVLRESLEVRKDRPFGGEGVSFDYAAAEDFRPGSHSPEGTDGGLPEVEEADYGTSSWYKGKIVAALVREADLDPALADEVASTVEQKVLHSGTRRISTSLIRELVDNELFERGFRTKLQKQQPIGLPKYNLEQVIFGTDFKEGYTFPKNPSEVRDIIANRILHQYSLQEVFSSAVADAHREGRLFIHRLTDPIRFARFRWDIPRPPGAWLSTARTGADGFSRAKVLAPSLDAGVPLIDSPGDFPGSFLDLGDFYRQLAHLEHFISEEIRLGGLTSLLLDPALREKDTDELARHIVDRLSQGEGGPDIALELDLTAISLPWLKGLLDLPKKRCGRFIISIRLYEQAFRSDKSEARDLMVRLYERGERIEFVPAGRRAGGPSHAGQILSVILSKITLNLPRAAYRSGKDRRGTIEAELDQLIDLAIKGLLERRQFSIRLAQNRENPLWELLGNKSAQSEFINLNKDVEFAVGILGLNECVKYLTGRELHQAPSAIEKGLEIIRTIHEKLRREARGLGIRLRLEETDNLGPLHVLEKADRRLYPEISEIDHGRREDVLASHNTSYTDGVRMHRSAPVDPLRRLEELAPFLAHVEPASGVIEDIPELRSPDCELLLSLLEEGLPALIAATSASGGRARAGSSTSLYS